MLDKLGGEVRDGRPSRRGGTDSDHHETLYIIHNQRCRRAARSARGRPIGPAPRSRCRIAWRITVPQAYLDSQPRSLIAPKARSMRLRSSLSNVLTNATRWNYMTTRPRRQPHLPPPPITVPAWPSVPRRRRTWRGGRLRLIPTGRISATTRRGCEFRAPRANTCSRPVDPALSSIQSRPVVNPFKR